MDLYVLLIFTWSKRQIARFLFHSDGREDIIFFEARTKWRNKKNCWRFLNSAIGVRKGSILELWIHCHKKHSFSNFHLVYGKVLIVLERRWYVAKKGIFGWENIPSTISLEQTILFSISMRDFIFGSISLNQLEESIMKIY